jgi:Domain of unknown function (DUF3846)
MKALLIPTHGPLQDVEQHGLRDLHRHLHGPIEALSLDGRDDAAAYVNEHGFLDDLADNPRATRLLAIQIHGPAVLCGFNPVTGEQTPVPDDLAATVLAIDAARPQD